MKKYRNNLLTPSVSLSIVCLLSHIQLFFVLVVRLEVSISTVMARTRMTTITHDSIRLLLSVTQAASETSVQALFCFAVRERERENRPSWRCRLLCCYWAFYLFLSLCCVVLCVAGRYCFRLIAAVVVDFSSSSSSSAFHAHSHMPLIFFPQFIGKKKAQRERERETKNSFTRHPYILISTLSSSSQNSSLPFSFLHLILFEIFSGVFSSSHWKTLLISFPRTAYNESPHLFLLLPSQQWTNSN